jgi:hypothetical protein
MTFVFYFRIQMLPYITALKIFNQGSPSWCIPRKNTEGSKRIDRIRKGEKTETPKDIMDRLERKTEGRSKARRSQAISLA